MSSLKFNPKLFQKEIIENGSNANGNYIKYADGTMICSNRKTINTTLSTAYGAFYISPVLGMDNFPVEFINIPTITSYVESTSNTFVLSASITNKTKAGGIYLIGNFNIASLTCIWNYIAIGRWK